MIKVQIIKEDDKVMLSVKGHAGYADKGEDIVCAGVSAIIFGLMNALDEKIAKIKVDENDITIKILKEDLKTSHYMELAILQLRTMEESYGQFIKIQERRTS